MNIPRWNEIVDLKAKNNELNAYIYPYFIDMRKSYIKRNNIKNASMNKGTFFVHKREKSVKPVERNQSYINRASTILNASSNFKAKFNKYSNLD